ncbi:hypothetical protein Tco_0393726 [Tanacetum coccineum]
MGRGTWYYSLGVSSIVDAFVRSAFGISSWRGSRVDGRSYLLSGAIDSSEANGIIRDPKSCKVRVGSNGNLLWEASVLYDEKKVETLKFAAMPFGLTNAPAVFMELMSRSGSYGLDKVRTSIWRDVRTLAIEEAYMTKYSIHPGADTVLCGFRLWRVEGLTLEMCSTFGKKYKLEPGYVGPFEILGWIGPIVRLRISVL